MKSYQYDNTGALVSSSSTDGGGGSSASGKSLVRMGYLWPSSGAYPTSLTAHREQVSDGGTVATVTQGDAMTEAGTVVALAAYIYGSTGGQAYTWTLYKNGAPTSLTCSTSRTDAGPAKASGSIAFAIGDVLQVWSMAASGATAQATKASLTVALT